MKPFDEKATCPKCGGSEVKSRHEPRGRCPIYERADDKEKGEHLRRICRRCKFAWNEACLDSKEVSELVLCPDCGTAAVGCCECGDDYIDGGNEMCMEVPK